MQGITLIKLQQTWGLKQAKYKSLDRLLPHPAGSHVQDSTSSFISHPVCNLKNAVHLPIYLLSLQFQQTNTGYNRTLPVLNIPGALLPKKKVVCNRQGGPLRVPQQ
jgi:hypothetical protein